MTRILGVYPAFLTAKARGILVHGGATRCLTDTIGLILPGKRYQGSLPCKNAPARRETPCFPGPNGRRRRHAALLRQVWKFQRGPRWWLWPGNPLHLAPAGAGGCLIALLAALPVAAEGWRSGSSFESRVAETRPAPAGSSFAGLAVVSSFDQPQAQQGSGFHLPAGGPALVKLRALIQHAESRAAGYDAWHGRARVPPPKPPSRMTLGEIRRWIAATPGQQHAIGRYQIIPSTLESLIRRTGLPPDTVFGAAVQDRMADLLIHDAGYGGFVAGRLPPDRFMDNLARIWAGFPLASGRSAYHGIAGNRATVTRAFFAGEMRQIFPQEWARAETGIRVAAGG